MLDRFVGAIKTYATTQDIPLITFERGQRKDDVVADYRARRPMADGVIVIGVAQEKMRAFKAHKRSGPAGRRHLRLLAAIGRRQSLLLLRPGSGVGPGVPQVRDVPALSDQAVSQRPRVGEATAAARAASRLTVSTTASSRVPTPTRLQAICDHLGPGRRAGVLRSLDGAAAGAAHRASIAPPATRTGSRSSKWRSA